MVFFLKKLNIIGLTNLVNRQALSELTQLLGFYDDLYTPEGEVKVLFFWVVTVLLSAHPKQTAHESVSVAKKYGGLKAVLLSSNDEVVKHGAEFG